MTILVVNDDGINAEGIKRLAELAKEFGDVWVVAPEDQCSAMSHRITVRGDISVCPVEFPVDDVIAYSVTGTPADCVKIALREIMPKKPDVVFSGINLGYNVGFDILYSGTVGAAMEALISGVPALAFSMDNSNSYDVVEAHFIDVVRDLMSQEISEDEIWNVNFPCCHLSEFKGIMRDRTPERKVYHMDGYERIDSEDGRGFILKPGGEQARNGMDGTDIHAVLDNYISVGKIKNNIMSINL